MYLIPILKNDVQGLAASLGYGAASEILRRTGSGSQDSSSVMMTEANIKRLVMKLSQMRGAALKLGQFMSIQGMSLTLHPCFPHKL
jgi:aarF domain-containing kinase